MSAVCAALDMTAEGRGAAAFDRRHDFQLLQAQMPGLSRPVIWTKVTKNIGDFQCVVHNPFTMAVVPSVPSMPSLYQTAM